MEVHNVTEFHGSHNFTEYYGDFTNILGTTRETASYNNNSQNSAIFNENNVGNVILDSSSLDVMEDVININDANKTSIIIDPIAECSNLTYNLTTDSACPNISLDDFSILSSIVYIMLVLLGSFLCIAGFRYIRPSLFIMATTLMSTVVYIICSEVFIQTPLPPLVIAGSSILSGILVGLAALLLLSIGIRITCCKAGLVVGVYILASIRLFLNYPNPLYLRKSVSMHLSSEAQVVNIIKDENIAEVITGDDNSYSTLDAVDDDSTSPSLTSLDDIHHILPIIITTIVLLVCCILIIIASFLKPKFSLILSFALAGSAMITLGLDFFTDKQLTLTNLFLDCLVVRLGKFSDAYVHAESINCWSFWVVLGLLPALVLISVLMQYLCTARGIDYTFNGVGVCTYKQSHIGASSSSSTSSTRRAETSNSGGKRTTLERIPVLGMDPSEKYRHLYRVRRTNGDVISRTQMEAIEVRKSNPIMMVATRSSSDVTTTNDDADDVTLVLTRTGDE